MNQITTLQDDQGRWIGDYGQLEQMMVSYVSNLYLDNEQSSTEALLNEL